MTRDKRLKEKEHFKYLGNTITRAVFCTKEIRMSIFNAKVAFMDSTDGQTRPGAMKEIAGMLHL